MNILSAHALTYITSPEERERMNVLDVLPEVETVVITGYVVIDRHTGQQVGHSYATRARASRRVDQLDNAYGAYRYSVRTVTQ